MIGDSKFVLLCPRGLAVTGRKEIGKNSVKENKDERHF
jgi:hypothetical protein